MQLQSGIVLISRKRSSDLSKLTKRAQRSANKHSDPGFFRRVSEQYTATTQGMKASIPEIIFCSQQKGTSRMQRMWSPDAMIAASGAINCNSRLHNGLRQISSTSGVARNFNVSRTLMVQRGKPKPCIYRKLKMPAKDEIVSQYARFQF
jgi:hypothetical protein